MKMAVRNSRTVSIKEIIGGGYDEFWASTRRYVVCKGGRASKKSTTAALKIITRMMQYPLANTLVIRKYDKDNRDSTYAQLMWAINRLGVGRYWQGRLSPLEIEYKPTHQKILFRGLDSPEEIKSITVPHGYLCWAWLNKSGHVKPL